MTFKTQSGISIVTTIIAIIVLLIMIIGGKFLSDSLQNKEAAAKLLAQQNAQIAAKQRAEAEAERAIISRKSQAEKAMKSAFERILVDPVSVQYRGIKVVLDVPASKIIDKGSSTQLVDVVCGEYNAKNRMGGYGGYKYFHWNSFTNEIDSRPQGIDDKLSNLVEEIIKAKCDNL